VGVHSSRTSLPELSTVNASFARNPTAEVRG